MGPDPRRVDPTRPSLGGVGPGRRECIRTVGSRQFWPPLFGEMTSNLNIERLNQFLNEKVDDIKLRDRNKSKEEEE